MNVCSKALARIEEVLDTDWEVVVYKEGVAVAYCNSFLDCCTYFSLVVAYDVAHLRLLEGFEVIVFYKTEVPLSTRLSCLTSRRTHIHIH